MPDETGVPDTKARARQLAERALEAQAAGRDDEADRLFTEGQAIDPDAVAEVLREHDAAHEPDSRDQRTFDRDRVEQHVVEEEQSPAGRPGGAS